MAIHPNYRSNKFDAYWLGNDDLWNYWSSGVTLSCSNATIGARMEKPRDELSKITIDDILWLFDEHKR